MYVFLNVFNFYSSVSTPKTKRLNSHFKESTQSMISFATSSKIGGFVCATLSFTRYRVGTVNL